MLISRKPYAADCVKEVVVHLEYAYSQVRFNFWCEAWDGVVSRNVAERIPSHMLEDVRGFVQCNAAAPLLDYLTEREDQLTERLNRAVAEALEEFNSEG